MARSSPRPWRAIAYVPDATAPNGRRRAVAGRTAAVERSGLDEFIKRQRRAGNLVDVWHLETLIP